MCSLNCQDWEGSICKKPSRVSRGACVGTQLRCNWRLASHWLGLSRTIVSQSTRWDVTCETYHSCHCFCCCFCNLGLLLLLQFTIVIPSLKFSLVVLTLLLWNLPMPAWWDKIKLEHSSTISPLHWKGRLCCTFKVILQPVQAVHWRVHFLSAVDHTVGSPAET